MGSLKNKVAIVTGSGTGIGQACALMFADEGATLVLVGRRREPLEKTASDCESRGSSVLVLPTDLEDGDAAEKVVLQTIQHCGRVDILINNAGHSSRVRSVKYVDPDEFQSVFRVNVEGLYRITQAAVRDMLLRQEGTVITVSSMAAITPGLLGGLPYGAAKAASFNMMRSINAELRAEGIRACTILPGEVDTPILDNRPLPPDAEARETMMQAEDVAAAILLCASMPQRTLIEEMTMLPTQPRNVSSDMKAAREIKSSEDQYSLKDL